MSYINQHKAEASVAERYIADYDAAVAGGNSHEQASAYAEWRLFAALARVAPEGSYACHRQASYWLRRCGELRVVVTEALS